jgi:hypothetical protein
MGSGRFWREILLGSLIQREWMEHEHVAYVSERSLPPSGPETVNLGD